MTVNASADASAEGLTKPFAGGQVARGGRVGILGNQDIMETPFSSTSYTNELIQDQQAKSVADVLLNDPSVRTARGFGNFQELYMVRGFPVYSDDVAYNGLYGMLPRQYIAAEFIERVEVFRGANSFLNGAAPGGSGIGGSINLLPKRAPNEPLTRAGLSYQSGGQASISTDIARRFGPDQATGLRLNAVKRDGGTGVDNEKNEAHRHRRRRGLAQQQRAYLGRHRPPGLHADRRPPERDALGRAADSRRARMQKAISPSPGLTPRSATPSPPCAPKPTSTAPSPAGSPAACATAVKPMSCTTRPSPTPRATRPARASATRAKTRSRRCEAGLRAKFATGSVGHTRGRLRLDATRTTATTPSRSPRPT